MWCGCHENVGSTLAITFHAGPLTFALEQEELALVEQASTGVEPLLGLGRIDPYGRATYGSPGEIKELADELAMVRREFVARRTAQLVRERGIRARTPELIDQAVAPLLAREPVLG